MKPVSRRRGDSAGGYSLIEVIVVVVLIGLLAAIATPGYQRVVRKSHRAAAMALLQELHLRQHRWRADNPAYASTLEQIGAPTNGSVIEDYLLSIPRANASGYTLRALARESGSQQGDTENGIGCAQLEIDQSGQRQPPACWR